MPSATRRLAPQSQAGFTIVEVAMATFVMAFGIATSIVVLQSGFKHLDLARSTTMAGQVLQSEMERIRMMSFAGVEALPEQEVFDGARYFAVSDELRDRYTVTRTRNSDSDRPADIINLTLRVTWNSYDGRSHLRSLSAIYAKNGLYDYYYTVARP